MKVLIDFFPLLGFFIAYYVFDIYVATGVLMVAAVIQTVGNRLLKKEWEKMHLFTLGLALVFGSLTLLFRDDAFIKWKVTILMWMLAVVFLFRQWVQNRIVLKDLLEGMSGESFGIEDALWKRLNVIWACCALAVGLLNLWVAYTFSQSVWVNFKVWGITIIQFTLMMITFAILFKNMPEDAKKALEGNDTDNTKE
ncbi:inner membrane-spanning protein YciB [Pleionea sp. CnH1-48]|uniref:inner membrane-spanning protein YciB n=1 Tax=Pleionea sp. CnH1-48 TaxID=2954494 RepID=UPI002096ECB6|nr:inner membrane-spanning protein YciB [Pleionea sp. CnH1-48]MCO7226364.1 septation protein IspZ [Pleionea sp. CnH1-48]